MFDSPLRAQVHALDAVCIIAPRAFLADLYLRRNIKVSRMTLGWVTSSREKELQFLPPPPSSLPHLVVKRTIKFEIADSRSYFRLREMLAINWRFNGVRKMGKLVIGIVR